MRPKSQLPPTLVGYDQRNRSQLVPQNLAQDMDLDPEVRRTRARQVGMLMQTYRRAHDVKGRRLSQEGLLRLMGEADPRYLERYDRSTVARWESGEIRPTRETDRGFRRKPSTCHPSKWRG